MSNTKQNLSVEEVRPSQSQMEIATTRAAQEVQAAMVIAKKFPRDQDAAFQRIIQACRRKNLAEQAIYVYPRGGQEVTGPSIRLAESLAQNWGNLEFGVIELEQKLGESVVMAFAWDLETNTRQTKVFSVPHIRYSKNKGSTELTDPRDIYELVANNGARRLRACILGVIPGDIVDAACDQCEKTLKEGNKEPLSDRVRNMIVAFKDIGVTKAMIETKIGHKTDSINETELVRLKKVYVSIRDGIGKREDFFAPEVAADPGAWIPKAGPEDAELAAAGLAPQQEVGK